MENCQEMGEGMVELLENKMNSLQDLDKVGELDALRDKQLAEASEFRLLT